MIVSRSATFPRLVFGSNTAIWVKHLLSRGFQQQKQPYVHSIISDLEFSYNKSVIKLWHCLHKRLLTQSYAGAHISYGEVVQGGTVKLSVPDDSESSLWPTWRGRSLNPNPNPDPIPNWLLAALWTWSMCTEDHKVVLYSLLLYMLDATYCITNPNPNPNTLHPDDMLDAIVNDY